MLLLMITYHVMYMTRLDSVAGFKRTIFNYLGLYSSQPNHRRSSYQLSAYELREPSTEQSEIVDAIVNDPRKCLQIDSVAVSANGGLLLYDHY